MPKHARDPATNTSGIEFGQGRGQNMATERPSSSGTRSREGQCIGCVRKRDQGHQSAREPKFCEKHQCMHKDNSGVLCTTRKKKDDIRCASHTNCRVPHCANLGALDEAGIPNDYCFDHGCPVDYCNKGKVHDPRRNVYDALCAEHLPMKCAVTSCFHWKSGAMRYCEQHQCVIEPCGKKVISESRPFCLDHNACRVEGCVKERIQFGNRYEVVCVEHFVPPCASRECSQKSSLPSRYCDMHACQRQNCTQEARPGRGRPFCVEHKCTHDECQSLRTFSEIDGKLKKNELCALHECRTDECLKLNVPDIPYCISHSCTKQGCKQPRDRDPRFGTLCYQHYENKISDAATLATERRLNEELARAAEASEAEARARARAEESRRHAQIPHRPREEHPRRQDELRYNAPSPRRPERQEGLRPDRDHRYEDPYEDEGYRSRPGSGAPAYGTGW